jgi:TonB family protein
MFAQRPIVSALMFWLLVFVPCAECSQTLHPPETGTSCTVKQTDDDSKSRAELEFTGQVRAGDTYNCKFISGFNFRLEPDADGWLIAIREDKRNENLARFSPLVADQSPILIALADVLREETKRGTHGESEYEERKFYFSPAVGRSVKKKPTERQLAEVLNTGRGLFRITSVEMTKNNPGETESVAAMSFNVSINLRAVRGTPVYTVGADITPPEAVYMPDPKYSKEARKAGLEGTVVLWMIVGVDGKPIDIQVARSIGMGLDEQAIEAVRNWRFKPARKDGQAVPVTVNVELRFRLS